MLPELLVNPALPRALAVGAFGGVGLVLTVVYSRRGPLIFVPYAALLAALTLLLSQFGPLPYAPRFAAAYAAVAMATVPVYVAVRVVGKRQRERRLSAEPRPGRVSLWRDVWRIRLGLGVG